MDESEILSRDEVQAVIYALSQKRNKNAVLNRCLFRLSACCGLRRKEICGLKMRSIRLGGQFPHIFVDKKITKGVIEKRKTRKVPLWWDAGTLAEITAWYNKRIDDGATADDPFVCIQRRDMYGRKMTVKDAAARWRTAILALGRQRASELSIHTGRHTFISHSLAAGRSIIEVQRAAGHYSILTTQIYMHLVNRTDVPDVFGQF